MVTVRRYSLSVDWKYRAGKPVRPGSVETMFALVDERGRRIDSFQSRTAAERKAALLNAAASGEEA